MKGVIKDMRSLRLTFNERTIKQLHDSFEAHDHWNHYTENLDEAEAASNIFYALPEPLQEAINEIHSRDLLNTIKREKDKERKLAKVEESMTEAEDVVSKLLPVLLKISEDLKMLSEKMYNE